jgi:predicted GIY-YIG superfamily endonuclease
MKWLALLPTFATNHFNCGPGSRAVQRGYPGSSPGRKKTECRSNIRRRTGSTSWRVGRLVYFETHDDAAEAARRERSLKRWRRDWKIELIERGNPTWRDLFGDVVRADGFQW